MQTNVSSGTGTSAWQVVGVEHHERLLLGMGWASVVALVVREVREWFYQATRCALHWQLSKLDAPSWEKQWHHHQSFYLIFRSPVLP